MRQQDLWPGLDACRCVRVQGACCPVHPVARRLRVAGKIDGLRAATSHIKAAWGRIAKLRVRPHEPVLVALSQALEEICRYRDALHHQDMAQRARQRRIGRRWRQQDEPVFDDLVDWQRPRGRR